MLKHITSRLAGVSNEDVKTSHARMTVGREIEVAVGTERGKHLVARRVYRLPKILHTAIAGRRYAHAPDVEPALAAGHVRDEIEPLAIGRHSWMGKAGERVLGKLHA